MWTTICFITAFFATLPVLAFSNEADGAASVLEDLTIRHVLVPIVMEAEAKPFVEHLGLKPLHVLDDPSSTIFPPNTPFLAFTGVHHKTKVTVITMGKDTIYETGVDNAATVPSSLATYLALQQYQSGNDNNNNNTSAVDLVLNAGTCGGFQRKGASIGDVFVTTGVAYHDRRIPIPGFDTYGRGTLAVRANPATMATTLGYKLGICSTGNSLDWVERDDEIMKENDASVKDMEAAAIAWVAAMYDVPYLGIKVVTDIVDGGVPTQEEFLANLASAAESLQTALPRVLEYVCDNTKQTIVKDKDDDEL